MRPKSSNHSSDGLEWIYKDMPDIILAISKRVGIVYWKIVAENVDSYENYLQLH